MKLKTVVKLGTMVSVLLFGIAVGYYVLAELDMTKRNRDIDLFALVPDDCIGVIESNNINAYLNDFSLTSYQRELAGFQFPGLFDFLLNGLNEYAVNNAHGLSNQMNHLVVSFHRPSTPYDQVIYFQTGSADEHLLSDMLQEYMPTNFLPKEEKYRGKTLCIYPLGTGEFLTSYAESGFLVVSYQKRLVEEVIDAHLDGTSLSDDEVFSQALSKKKSHNYLTLYGRSASLPFLQMGPECWSEYDFHMNSDVLYLTGETYTPDSSNCLTQAVEHLADCPLIKESDWLVSADRDSTQCYMNEAYDANESGNRTLYSECVANLSNEASFALVADMQRVAQDPQLFRDYLPAFILNNAPLFRSFILSAQLTLTPEQSSHIWVFTYKD